MFDVATPVLIGVLFLAGGTALVIGSPKVIGAVSTLAILSFVVTALVLAAIEEQRYKKS